MPYGSNLQCAEDYQSCTDDLATGRTLKFVRVIKSQRRVSKSTTLPNNQININVYKNWINVHCPTLLGVVFSQIIYKHVASR